MSHPKTSRLGQVAVVAAMVGLAVACSVDVDLANKACPCESEYVCDTAKNVCVRPQELVAAAAPPVCDPCPCTTDPDCKDPSRPRCSPTTKTCVECTPADDQCRAGSYCNELFQCTLGCKNESDCKISPASPRCEQTRHQCVECTSSEQCADGKACSPSGACVESCAAKPCTNGAQCCQGLCLDVTSDNLNCGQCGVACSTSNGTPRCQAGACTWECASGFAHCDSGNTGCETNTRTDAAHCGACTANCDGLNANNVTCAAGACAFTTCSDGFGDCDNNRANGCECSCGKAKNERCCPGNVCVPGLTCNGGSGKCQ